MRGVLNTGEAIVYCRDSKANIQMAVGGKLEISACQVLRTTSAKWVLQYRTLSAARTAVGVKFKVWPLPSSLRCSGT